MPEIRTITYILRPGSTQEEQWAWENIEEMCRAGEIGKGTRVFLPETNEWALIEDTDLGELLEPGDSQDDVAVAVAETLREDYESTVARIADDRDGVDARLEAARIAIALGLPDEARGHLQDALDAHPFHPRVAGEARRRLSPPKCRELRYLDRPEAAWDDLAAMASWPWSRGPVYALAPWLVLFAVSLLPGGRVSASVISLAWMTILANAAASGSRTVPGLEVVRPGAVRHIVVPALVGIGAVGEVVGVFAAIAWLTARLGVETSRGAVGTIESSPVLAVLLLVSVLVSLPVALPLAIADRKPWHALLVWRWPAVAIRMETEFVTSALLMLAVALVAGAAIGLTASIPVIGNLVAWGTIAFAAPLTAMVVGRLAGRNVHRIDPRRGG